MSLAVEATHVSLLETSVTGVDLTRTDGTAAQPDWRSRFDARYTIGALRFAYSLNYLPSVRSTNTTTIETTLYPILDANYRHNVSAQYDLTEQLTLRAGVENLDRRDALVPEHGVWRYPRPSVLHGRSREVLSMNRSEIVRAVAVLLAFVASAPLASHGAEAEARRFASNHQGVFGGQKLKYSAVVEENFVTDAAGKRTASIFTTSYHPHRRCRKARSDR